MSAPARLLSIALVALASFAGSAAADGLTAKSSLDKALAEAHKWQPDAVLVDLSTTHAKPDGSATEWKYAFLSPKTQKRYVATASTGAVTGREVRLGNATEPIADFVDSDRVMAEAVKSGVKGGQLVMALKTQAQTKPPHVEWLVGSGYEQGVTWVNVDAKTGKLVKKYKFGEE
jgi:hypothetical protein